MTNTSMFCKKKQKKKHLQLISWQKSSTDIDRVNVT